MELKTIQRSCLMGRKSIVVWEGKYKASRKGVAAEWKEAAALDEVVTGQ